MKKTSINILCILIILLITGSVVTPVLYMTKYLAAGFKYGYEQRAVVPDQHQNGIIQADQLDFSTLDVMYEPDITTIMQSNDTVRFDSGEAYPIVMTRSAVMIPPHAFGNDMSWVVHILYVVCLVFYVLLLVQFIRFIININRGNIFEGKNVVRLRRFAIYLISISLLRCAAGLIEDHMLSTLSLRLDGYTLSAYWEMPWDTMLLGLLALLMAQIWSYGLQIREDQDLTI